jgi:CcmD family protein
MKTIISSLLLSFIPLLLSAQDKVEMADAMRSEGKIYVVVAIMLVIFFGLIAYVVLLDRKLSKLEKELNIKR